MKGSIITCALILLVASLLGWRERNRLLVKKEANARLLAEVAALAIDGGRTAIGSATPNDRLGGRNENVLTKAEVSALARDYLALFRDLGENPNGEADEQFKKVKADMKIRLEALDPSAIEQFMVECFSNPDLNLTIRRDINFYVRTVFISKYPLEMARMMGDSPELFGLDVKGMPEGYVPDPFQHLVFYYSCQKKDLPLVFQCLAQAPPAFQAKYIGGALDYYADSPPKRAELLTAMRNFASTPEPVHSQVVGEWAGLPEAQSSKIRACLKNW